MNGLNSLNGGQLDLPAIVRTLLGEPNRAFPSRAGLWRYGAKGSLCVDVQRGVFTDFEAGEGGGILDLIRREHGGTRADAVTWLKVRGLADSGGAKAADALRPSIALTTNLQPKRKRERHEGADEGRDMGARALALWRASLSPQSGPVEQYLASRGLALPADPARVLRYHPACPFEGQRLPAMMALIRNAETGKPQGVHRTALTPAGQRVRGADGEKLPKMMLGAAGGGAVMLSPDCTVESGLGIAEGIETGLAALQRAPWLPVWAALSAGGVKAFPVLRGLEHLTVYADADAAGMGASRALCERYADAGRFAELVRPRAAGADMADLGGGARTKWPQRETGLQGNAAAIDW